jgi:hypothetical protein
MYAHAATQPVDKDPLSKTNRRLSIFARSPTMVAPGAKPSASARPAPSGAPSELAKQGESAKPAESANPLGSAKPGESAKPAEVTMPADSAAEPPHPSGTVPSH